MGTITTFPITTENISDLAVAGALVGTEIVEIIQSGTNKQLTIGSAIERNADQNLQTTDDVTFQSVESNQINSSNGSDITTKFNIDYPDISTAAADWQIFAATNTSGTRTINIFKGDGTATITFAINADTGLVTTASIDTSSIVATALVTESEGIDSSDNDTSWPTSAATKDYVEQREPTSATTLTIASGAITIPDNPRNVVNHKVDTEAAAATDNLTAINGGREGQILILTSVLSTRDVTVVDGGLLRLAGNFTLDQTSDTITLYCDSPNNWFEMSRSDNF